MVHTELYTEFWKLDECVRAEKMKEEKSSMHDEIIYKNVFCTWKYVCSDCEFKINEGLELGG